MDPAVALERHEPVAGKLSTRAAVADPFALCTRSDVAPGASRVNVKLIGSTPPARVPLHRAALLERFIEEMSALGEGGPVVIACTAVQTADAYQL
jgi:hypothetical protein